MTREEAIKILRPMQTDSEEVIEAKRTIRVSMKVFDALEKEYDRAVQQLKELGYSLGEPIKRDGDTISRREAIDVVDSYDFNYPKYMERFVTELRDAIKADLIEDLGKLPSAQPEQMSIMIKNMKMPKNCAECELWSICKCLTDFNDYESILNAVDSKDLVRAKDCPLIDVSALAVLSAQPERKKGKWIRWYEKVEHEKSTEYIPHCKCSECGTEYDSHFAKNVRYCYVCGAEMRGGT